MDRTRNSRMKMNSWTRRCKDETEIPFNCSKLAQQEESKTVDVMF
jgi:hypothetical protein